MSSDLKISIRKDEKVARIDGPLKVTGAAAYTSDYHFDKMAYAVPVCAKVGKGKIKHIESSLVAKTPGVLGVFTRENIGHLYRPTNESAGMSYKIDESRPPFEDDEIRYYGQYVAVVVAETFELAQAGARALTVTYTSEAPNLAIDLKQEDLKKVEEERGDSQKAFDQAAVKIDHTYVTPNEVHNTMELHATVAKWDADRVTLYETSQAIHTQRNVMAQILGLPPENVQVISKFLGSGFGGKLWAWPHSALAAQTARKLGRPVKLVVDRHMEFTNVGHRPKTQQRVQLAADKDGHFQSLIHTYSTEASMLDDFKENCGEVSGFLYSIPNVKITSGVARRNQSTPTSMRGPGAVPGLFAVESAVDELAVSLKMDPVQLRLLNDTNYDAHAKKDFSSRHFKECLELGSQKFGWAKRNAIVASMRDGAERLGWGMAACTWQSSRLDADATVEFMADGHVRVSCGTHDIGTGMYTALAQIARQETGLPLEKIEILLGDTKLPPGPLAGGSMATGSVVPAVVEATRSAIKNLISGASKTPTSPLHGVKPDDIKYEAGHLRSAKNSIEFASLLKKLNMSVVTGRASSKGNFASKDKEKYSMKSFGAHFVEIGWNPDLARLRVRRVVSVIDGGHIINFQQARNQIEGAVVMGIGMGMFERAEQDLRDGFVTNSNLADYIVASHADCPEIDVSFLDYPDKAVNEYGARGVGEIGLAGIAPAICSAVYHATGVRVREIPVRIENLLTT